MKAENREGMKRLLHECDEIFAERMAAKAAKKRIVKIAVVTTVVIVGTIVIVKANNLG